MDSPQNRAPACVDKKQTSGVSTDPSGGRRTRRPSGAGCGGWSEAYGDCRGRGPQDGRHRGVLAQRIQSPRGSDDMLRTALLEVGHAWQRAHPWRRDRPGTRANLITQFAKRDAPRQSAFIPRMRVPALCCHEFLQLHCAVRHRALLAELLRVQLVVVPPRPQQLGMGAGETIPKLNVPTWFDGADTAEPATALIR